MNNYNKPVRKHTEKLKFNKEHQLVLLNQIHNVIFREPLNHIFHLNPEKLMIPYSLKNAIKNYVLVIDVSDNITNNTDVLFSKCYKGLIVINNTIYHIVFDHIVEVDEHGRSEHYIILRFKTPLNSTTMTINTNGWSYLKDILVSLFNFKYYKEKYKDTLNKKSMLV